MTTIQLAYPITIDGEPVSTLTFRRAKASDMIALADHITLAATVPTDGSDRVTSDQFKAVVEIVGRLSDIGAEAAATLDLADLTLAITTALAPFSEPTAATAGS